MESFRPPPPPEYGANQSPSFTLYMNTFTTLTYMFIGAIAGSAIQFANIFITSSATNSLKTHIYLCVTGYFLLIASAVLSVSPYTGWARSLPPRERQNVHMVMQVAGSLLAIIGCIIRMANVQSHFASAHGAFGVFTMVFTFFSLIGGAVNLFGSQFKLNKFVNIGHACLGSLTMSLAFITLACAFHTRIYTSLNNNYTNINMLTAFCVFALIGTITPAMVNLCRRLIN